jgi:membrane associated rhomboid family serine protease
MMAQSGIPQSVDLQTKLTELHIQEWLTEDFLHIRWWILLGSLAAMYIGWYLLLDKSKKKETCLFLVLAIIIQLAIDEYGDELILWEYPTDLIPLFPPLTSLNLISMPLSLSIAFQMFPDLKRYTVAALIISAAISFVLEPLLALGGLYELVNWQYIFSFLVYLMVAFGIRFVAKKLLELETKNRCIG